MDKLYKLLLNDFKNGHPYKILLITNWDSGHTKEEFVEYVDSFDRGLERVNELNQQLG